MIREFQNYLVAIKGYAQNTAVAYGKDLASFARWMNSQAEPKRWSMVTRDDIDKYMEYLVETDHKPATICRHLSSLQGIYNWFIRQQWMTENPVRYESRPKIGQRVINTIPTGDLMVAIKTTQGELGTILRLMTETGVRVQEVLDIRAEDIIIKQRTLIIHGKGNKERKVYMSERLTTELYMLAKKRYGRIFALWTQRDIRKAMYEVLKNISSARQLSPHAIRHTYATEMAKRGMVATTLQKLLGHDSIKTTQRYIDAAQIEVEQQARELAIIN